MPAHPGYAHWLNANGLDEQDLDSLDDWARLPPILANFFKQQLLLSPTGERALELTSSGTSGQKSRMRYDPRSLAGAQFMVERIFSHYGWYSPDTPCNYLLLSYEPQGAITLGTSYTDQFLCRFAPVNRVAYALRSNGDGHQFDVFGVITALQSFAAEGLPVRIFGFPAFLWQTLQHMQATGVPELKLPAGSLAFLAVAGKPEPARKSPNSNCMDASPGNWASKPRGAATVTVQSSTPCRTSNVTGIIFMCRFTPRRTCAMRRIFPSSPTASKACWDSSRPTFRPARRMRW